MTNTNLEELILMSNDNSNEKRKINFDGTIYITI